MGKTLVITGASKGIGKEAALHFAKAGHEVIAGVRSQAAADDLRDASNGRLKPVLLDISDPDSIERFITDYGKAFSTSGLYGLVNNAGIAVAGSVEHTTPEKWRRQFDVNFFGHIEITRRLLSFIRASQGRIVFTGSIAGKVAFPMGGPYCSSKFALEGVADSLRRELSSFGVFVSIVEPGGIETPMLASSEAMIQEAIDDVSGDGGEIYRQTGEGLQKTRCEI